MSKKHIIILGSGISGLSAAWQLSKRAPECEITILEEKERAGGWIQSSSMEGFFFELGPRVFKASKSAALLDLIKDLGLEDKIQLTRGAGERHILHEGKLQSVPSSLSSFLFSPLTRGLILPLLTEWRKKPLAAFDESIAEFITRRFGKKVLDHLFDPLTQGIYAEDPKELSIRSCFGMLKEWEDQYGSITSGLWNELVKKKKEKNSSYGGALFTLQGGVENLIKVLIAKVKCHIAYGQKALAVQRTSLNWEVVTQGKVWHADAVFIALPPFEAARVLQGASPEAAKDLSEIPSISITSVLVGFSQDVLRYEGFGYLVGAKEKLPILGAVFDSKTFGDVEKKQTRLTLMLKGSGYTKEEIDQCVDLCLKTHLHVEKCPEFQCVHVSEKAIPKFLVGHKDKVAFIERTLSKTFPNCFLLGNYLQGVSVSDCIKRSERQVVHFLNR